MLKRFGAYFVAGSIAVTGVLWYAREDRTVHGEDLAAVINQAMDTYLVGKLMGDAAPDYWGDGAPYDSFGSNILSGGVVGLEDLRKAALRVENLPAWQNPVWIDPQDSGKFADGAEIVSFTNRPLMAIVTNDAGAVTREYRAVTPAPVSNIRTLSSRAYNGEMPFVRGISLTNEPLCVWLDSSAAFGWSYPMWPSGSFWTADMGASAYTLPFKTVSSIDDFPVFLTPVLNNGMEMRDSGGNAIGGRVTLTAGAPRQTVALFATNGMAAGQSYALVRVTAADGQHAGSFAAADGAMGGVTLVPTSGQLAYEIGAGGTVEIPVSNRIRPLPANGRMRFAFAGGSMRFDAPGLNVSTNDSGFYSVTVSEWPGLASPGADIMRMWLDVPGVSAAPTYVAIGSAPRPGTAGPYLTRHAQYADPFRGAAFDAVLPVESFTPARSNATGTAYGRAIAERNLGAMRGVLTNCATTAYICPDTAGNFSVYRVEGTRLDSSIYTNNTGTFESNLATLYGRLAVSLTNYAPGPGHLYSTAMSFTETQWTDNTIPTTHNGNLTVTQTDALTLGLKYPSAHAVTNGLVNRIRVFAVYGLTSTVSPGDSAQTSDDYSGWAFGPQSLPLANYPRLSLADETGVDRTFSKGIGFADLYSGVRGFRGMKLNLLYDVSNPATANDLIFTHRPAPITPVNPVTPNIREDHTFNTYTYTLNRLSYSIAITRHAYVIVVDWNRRNLP